MPSGPEASSDLMPAIVLITSASVTSRDERLGVWMEEELITWIEDCRGKNIIPPLNICHDNRFSVSI